MVLSGGNSLNILQYTTYTTTERRQLHDHELDDENDDCRHGSSDDHADSDQSNDGNASDGRI